jgi:hypothetical protein
MSTNADALLEMLNDDIVSHGLVVQCLRQSESSTAPIDASIGHVLTELLASNNVDVGDARLSSPERVEFIAWKGTVEERVKRALSAIHAVNGPDQEFAYWLCLRRNVDRFE